jgi:hypothetical protein
METLSQAANVAAGGLLFGQFVSDRPFLTEAGLRRHRRLGDPAVVEHVPREG